VRHSLLNGLDAIGRTLQHEAEIAAFEQRVEPRVATTSL
jgi:3-isopropylmalate dehydratase small subunit